MKPLSRRNLLGAGFGLALGLAGCGEGGSSTTTSGELPTDPTTTAGELDLREANVTAVEFEPRDGGSYRFSVTLYHDDDGEDGYANWWQVERLDGTQLGRRKLRHAHSTDPFTRSETIEIPDDVSCVVVRGHDQTHGYGGQAAIVSLDSESVSFVGQDSDRQQVSGAACP